MKIDVGPALRTHELRIGGMTCAARVGRVERKLGGVIATVNLATARATVTHPVLMPVEELIQVVERAGYDAGLAADEAPGGDDADDRVSRLRHRLFVALVLFVPVADLSLALSLVPAWRFPYWQPVLACLALPVVAWSAWPFHRAALLVSGTAQPTSAHPDTAQEQPGGACRHSVADERVTARVGPTSVRVVHRSTTVPGNHHPSDTDLRRGRVEKEVASWPVAAVSGGRGCVHHGHAAGSGPGSGGVGRYDKNFTSIRLACYFCHGRQRQAIEPLVTDPVRGIWITGSAFPGR